ncbi:hypothetical protein FRC17_011081 [Serendipita sp. 399]|nr:hypothetical protein FRC17_011081 [Serendipita sp. 399]
MILPSLIWLLATWLCIVEALPASKMSLERRTQKSQVSQSNSGRGATKGSTTAKSHCPPKLHKRNAVCTVRIQNHYVPIAGTLLMETNSGGTLYAVTHAEGLAEGRYLVKLGLGPRELELAMATEVAIASTNGVTDPKQQCILMPHVGTSIRALNSYGLVYRTKRACEDWVNEKLQIVEDKYRQLLAEIPNFSHQDLCPQNTRWEGERKVTFIDYGQCSDQGGEQFNRPRELQVWQEDLCGPRKGPHSAKEFDIPLINQGQKETRVAHAFGDCCENCIVT